MRWGVLGAGAIAGRALVPALLAADGCDVVHVGARDGARAAAFAERFGIARSSVGYAGVLADPDVEVVYVALANDAHRPWTLAALAAGKHVLCEKPLGLSAAEVDEMAAAATAAGRVLVEALWYRWHPRIRRLDALVAAGAVGAVRHVRAGFTFDGVAAGNYRLDPARGGGAMYDLGCYPLSAVLSAFGAMPEAVTARLQRAPTGVDLTADLIVEFADGAAEVHVSMGEPTRQWLAVTGEAGEVELPEQAYTASAGLATELWVSRGTGTERTPVAAADTFALMVDHVARAIRGEAAWVQPLAATRAVAAVVDAAFASAASGGPSEVGVTDPA